MTQGRFFADETNFIRFGVAPLTSPAPDGRRPPLLRHHREGCTLRRGAKARRVPNVRVSEADHRAHVAILEQRDRSPAQVWQEDPDRSSRKLSQRHRQASG